MGYVLGQLVTPEKMTEMLHMNDHDFKACFEKIVETEMALNSDLIVYGNAYWVVRDGLKVRVTWADVFIEGTDYVVEPGEVLMQARCDAPDGVVGVSPVKSKKPVGLLGVKPGAVYFDEIEIDGDVVRDLDTRFGKAHLKSLDHVPGVLRNVSHDEVDNGN